jgi:hypothetical protein
MHRSTQRSRWWLRGGGSRHPFLYRRPEVIDLRTPVVGPLMIDLTTEEEPRSPVRRRGVDPFVAARRTPLR